MRMWCHKMSNLGFQIWYKGSESKKQNANLWVINLWVLYLWVINLWFIDMVSKGSKSMVAYEVRI